MGGSEKGSDKSSGRRSSTKSNHERRDSQGVLDRRVSTAGTMDPKSWNKERRRSSTSSVNTGLPNLQWSGKTYTPSEFPGIFNKPQVARLLAGEHQGWEGSFPVPGKRVDLGAELDTSQPFLIYSHRRRTKVFAEHLSMDKKKKSFQPDGTLLEIPKDYIGWLEVVSKDGQSRGHHCNISSVIATGCKYFLTRTTLRGFNVTEGEENGMEILGEKSIYPGEVVKVEKIITKKWKLVDGTLRGLIKPETSFLKCTDLHKNELCVSMAHPGVFNPVAQHGLEKEDKVVYLIHDITKVFKLPIYVKLAFGWPPKLSGGREFTGVMKLNEIDKRESLVAYNFIPGKIMITEIPTDVNVRLQTIDNIEEVEENATFKRAMDKCVQSVYPYVVGMKDMAIRYESVAGPTSSAKKRSMVYSRMAKALDMRQFSRTDIFPPLEEQQNSTLSRLSFKDPERNLIGLYHMDIESILETDTDGSILAGRDPDSVSRTSSNASSNLTKLGDKLTKMDMKDQEPTYFFYEGSNSESPPPPPVPPKDSREAKMYEINAREAPC